MNTALEYAAAFHSRTNRRTVRDIIAWAKEFVRLPGSARSETYDPTITPWTEEPTRQAAAPETRVWTFQKPIQAGGSVVGEILVSNWIANETGDIQYNWESDDKAGDRWDKRVERILLANPAIVWPVRRFDTKKRLVMFPNGNFTMQGVHTRDNLDSDSCRWQCNEEIHNWPPGRLSMAYGRTTAYWNATILNISNAGQKGGQLDQAFQLGTQQHWQVKCPGCRKFHIMRTRWEDHRPDLGGLRYSAEGARRPDGTYDYLKLLPTIRYQMPCGYIVHDTTTERRRLSLSGRYSKPQNTGAPPGHYSYTLDCVAVDYVPWLTLIEEKHKAIRARRLGDPQPWFEYLTRRECLSYDPTDVPLVGLVTLSQHRKKNRDGMPNRAARFAALDYQSGKKDLGELSHWWLVIRDFDEAGNSLLVWEGKLETDQEAAATLEAHEVKPSCVVVDSGYSASHVYHVCLKYGWHAIKGGKETSYAHEDGARRIFSPERPLHAMLNRPPTQRDPAAEPQYWLYSKAGIQDRLHYLMHSDEVRWETPADVSEDYKRHMESIQQEVRRNASTGEPAVVWHFIGDRFDLRVCEAYICMLAEMAELIGVGALEEPEEAKEETKAEAAK